MQPLQPDFDLDQCSGLMEKDSLIDDNPAERRLIMVSNRLPVVLACSEDGTWRSEPGSGGLINALAPVLQERGGVWVGWTGTTVEDALDLDGLLAQTTENLGYQVAPVVLTAAERDAFYLGFSNEIIWPLFHDLQSRCNFAPYYWTAYTVVNRTFAQAVIGQLGSNDYVWVHDYHLMHVAAELRGMGVSAPIGFFLHIPFPPLDIFLKLPWRTAVLRALLQYDLIGFQTLRDRANFIQCLRALCKGVELQDEGSVITAHLDGQTIRLGHFPIGIDAREFVRHAATEEVTELSAQMEQALPACQRILGIDRLDYTKGIPERLEAFRRVLLRFPNLRRRITLMQIVVPSRTDIREYSDLKMEIERLVSEINGEFTEAGWVPIHYMYRRMERAELLAYYRCCEIALVTPLKDGMNLVAKEYCVSSREESVLILSEFAGATAQLQQDALLVNPYDVEGVATAIAQAWRMPARERRARMRAMRQVICEHDVFWWVDSFLQAASEPQPQLLEKAAAIDDKVSL